MPAFLELPFLAALLGFALARSNSCTVAAVVRLVDERKADWIAGLGIAAAAAGISLMALVAWQPGAYELPTLLTFSWAPVIGGAIMGAGALANGGCMLGSVSTLGRGNLNYLFTLIGLALSLIVTGNLYALPMVEAESVGMSYWSEAYWPIFGTGFALLIGYGTMRLVRQGWASTGYLFLIGVIGALLFATNPYWSYLAAIDRTVRGEVFGMALITDLAALLLFLGATFSAWLRDRLDLVGFQWRQAAGCLLGGTAMGFGAQMIPGGNDTLLLWTIPGLATYGALGYLSMIAAIGIGYVALKAMGAVKAENAQNT